MIIAGAPVSRMKLNGPFLLILTRTTMCLGRVVLYGTSKTFGFGASAANRSGRAIRGRRTSRYRMGGLPCVWATIILAGCQEMRSPPHRLLRPGRRMLRESVDEVRREIERDEVAPFVAIPKLHRGQGARPSCALASIATGTRLFAPSGLPVPL